ncbi:MAG: flagellar hook assembly protein FlgD [Nitrospinota bacterium]
MPGTATVPSALVTLGNDPLSPSPPSQALGRDQFLRLLVAQLTHQNPLDPMKGVEFVTQLSQFSSLEQLFDINDRLQSLESLQRALASTQSVGAIGKRVLARGNNLEVTDSWVSPIVFELMDSATEVVVAIKDSSGRLVRTLEQNTPGTGRKKIEWDGMDGKGEKLPEGGYSFSVYATDFAGQSVEAVPYTSGIVTGVSFEEGETELSVGSRRVKLKDVIEISSPAGGENNPAPQEPTAD